jgi:ADP-ribose pyrophosphatase
MEFEEKTLKSELVFDGKVMTVLKDQIELADGYKSFREVVVHNGGVVVVALKNDDTILLVKQFRYPLKSVSLELPAGKLELNEDPNEACKRELEEETGYQAKNWKSLGYIHTSPGFCTEKLYLYLASDLEFVGEHPDEGEIVKTLEYSKSEVLKMIHNGTINDSKTICAIFRAFK